MTSTSSDAPPRHDFFQTPTQVIVSVYIKGCSEGETQLDLEEDSLILTVQSKSISLKISPLFAKIDKTNSSFKIINSKIELSLIKLQPGIQWPTLERNDNLNQTPLQSTATITPTIAGPSSTTSPNNTSSIAGRNKSKWDSFKDEDETEGKEDETGAGSTGKDGSGGDASMDAFFKKLYADADDDTRRAMMKSYQESGGTALSTNWEEVRKGKVETKPPQGMEARKW